MLDFHTLTSADRATVQTVTFRVGRRNCNFSMANLVGWKFRYHTELCVLEDALVLRLNFDGVRSYMLCMKETPSGELLQALREDSGHPLTLFGLEDETVQELKRTAARKGMKLRVNSRPDQYDYIYCRTELATLHGRRLQAKRNYVNHFRAEYPDFEYRPLEPSLFDDCRRVAALWHDAKKHDNPVYGDTLEVEKHAMEAIFAHWDELGMLGGSIFVNGSMVAFSYGSAITADTFDVCVEKANPGFQGVFSVINQQFCAHLPEQFNFVNREEDMGLPGLRKAKLSYHPVKILTFNVVQIA